MILVQKEKRDDFYVVIFHPILNEQDKIYKQIDPLIRAINFLI